MSDWLASGRLVDAILLFMVAEGAAIAAFGGRLRLALRDVAASLAAGACLLLALRAALVGAAFVWILLFFALALVAHLADLAARRRRSVRGDRRTAGGQ